METPKTMKEGYEKRAALLKELTEIYDSAKREKRALLAEEQVKFDAIAKDIDEITAWIDTEKRAQELLKLEGEKFQETREVESTKELRKKAFESYLRKGYSEMTPEERVNLFKVENRATGQVSDVAGQGGYLVPESWSNDVEVALKSFGGLLNAATILRTSDGRKINYPQINDTSEKATILGQLVAASAATKTFTSAQLAAFTYVTDAILVSYELLRDSAYDINALLVRLHAEAIARAFNEHATTGNGTTQPQGIVTAAANSGITAAKDALTYDNLIDLKFSIDPAYRQSPKFGFMFNDATLKAIRKLTDDYGQPIWQPSNILGEPDLLLGVPYYINPDMADIGTSTKSVLAGDFSKFLVRMVQDVSVLRLQERYADQLAIGFIGFQSLDARLLSAGSPVKYLVHAAS